MWVDWESGYSELQCKPLYSATQTLTTDLRKEEINENDPRATEELKAGIVPDPTRRNGPIQAECGPIGDREGNRQIT